MRCRGLEVSSDRPRNVYVVDSSNNRVVKLAAGSATPTVLPFTGLNGPGSVAVDAAGNLYVTESFNVGTPAFGLQCLAFVVIHMCSPLRPSTGTSPIQGH
jgi:hypothetical protein